MSEAVGVQAGRMCPRCGAENSVPLIMGMPSFELFELADRGLVVLGGCMVGPDAPFLACRTCELEWGSDENLDG